MESVQPLRISKPNTPASSPGKMSSIVPTSRPLAEIGSTEKRRNSPSYNQATRKMIVSQETSPYTENSSPPSFFKGASRDFWHGRDTLPGSPLDTENIMDRSPSMLSSSPRRRPSVERLAQASRVKNSNIFALESKDAYDPSNVPVVERPSANRPLSQSISNNAFTRYDSLKKENNPYRALQSKGHARNESELSLSNFTPAKSPRNIALPSSPEKRDSPASSPTKSSLARTSMFDAFPGAHFEGDSGMWSDGEERAMTPGTLRRHAKSVTFHEEPPEVNEYEQQTPEPSLSVASDREGSWESEDFDDHDISYDRGSSADPERDDSFDADLENADKTPVVLPEDWSRMSPDEARTDLVNDEDNVFDRSESETRPLPPLPAMARQGRSDSDSLANVAERAAHTRRILPSPPKRASCSKEEILNMTSQSSLTLEDRLKLMNGHNGHSEKPPSKSSEETPQSKEEELIVTNLDTGEMLELRVQEAEIGEDSVADLAEFTHAPPRISRESILRKVRNSKYDFEDESEEDESEFIHDGRPPISELAKMHPDEPIPSRENSRETSSSYSKDGTMAPREYQEVTVKEEPVDDGEFDMSSIPAASSHLVDYDRQSSVLRHNIAHDFDSDEESASRESSMAPDAEGTMIHNEIEEPYPDEEGKETLQDAMGLLTVKDYSENPTSKESAMQNSADFMGLPSYLGTEDYDFGLKDWITPSPPQVPRGNGLPRLEDTTTPNFVPSVEPRGEVITPPAQELERDVSPPGTPESVIHHSDEHDRVSPLTEQELAPSEFEAQPEPVVPERQATIRTGGKLKTRKSGTQADLMAMAEQRRMVSAELPVPPIPQEYEDEVQFLAEETEERPTSSSTQAEEDDHVSHDDKPPGEDFARRRKSRKSGGRMDLSLDTSTFSIGDQDGLGLDQEFDRLIEAQKKGYLMRQNTKLIVAARSFSGESDESNGTAKTDTDAPPMSPSSEARPASRGTKSANSSPRKGSGEQFFQTEPWNGKQRRKSIRNTSVHKSFARSEVAPPLPGKESALDTVNEDFAAGNLEEDVPEGIERGRLFVKVVAVKGLDLPMPKNDRIYFQLTLDNGLHCVTTSDMELGNSAPIGQEFELIVLNDLEFQLTLTTKLPPQSITPAPTLSSSPNKAKAQKQSGFSRLLSSPKKRAEKERQEREALEEEERRQQEEARRKRASIQPTAWDLLHELVNAQDGSFARAYVNLKAHEKSCFGRQLTVDVPCYNEWALEQDDQVVTSVRSKRGNNTGPIRRPPYVVGQLQLQLLYVPKPNGAVDADLPKSMSAAVREMGKASDVKEVFHEGHLSQQGGDCIHWRRRCFRLQGPRLTAYHEHTHQKRAVINLSKASRLVDDKSSLIAAPTTSKPGAKGRRKSAFAEEDEGYQYVEEGFRIRFANGETIDFYADTSSEKDRWMVALSQVIGKPEQGVKATRWTDLVLARERSTANTTLRQNGTEVKDFTQTAATAATTTTPSSAPPPPPAPPARTPSHRKALPASAKPGSKSAPTSPVKTTTQRPASSIPVSPKKPATTTKTNPPTASAPTGKRSGAQTPPLQARRGHRTRDAVKSMIF